MFAARAILMRGSIESKVSLGQVRRRKCGENIDENELAL